MPLSQQRPKDAHPELFPHSHTLLAQAKPAPSSASSRITPPLLLHFTGKYGFTRGKAFRKCRCFFTMSPRSATKKACWSPYNKSEVSSGRCSVTTSSRGGDGCRAQQSCPPYRPAQLHQGALQEVPAGEALLHHHEIGFIQVPVHGQGVTTPV